jgi:hypothetical protein
MSKSMPDDVFNAKMEVHYAAVGKVASNWAGFEHRIQWAIWSLAKIDNLTGACITTQIGNSARLVEAVIALLRLRGVTDQSLVPLNKFAEKVGDKQRQRNRIVHDPWAFKMPGGEAARNELSAKRRVVSDFIPHPTTDVEAFAGEI